MEAAIFPLRFQFKEKIQKYWSGLLFSHNKLIGLVLPLRSSRQVQKKLQALAKADLSWIRVNPVILKSIQNYFLGKSLNWYPKLGLNNCTQFAQKVLKIVSRIPRGETRSYSWVAKEAGRPNAQRAVGTVLANNPLPLIIPCHRVIKKNGNLGRFSGGFDESLKKVLLDLEQRPSVK